MNSRVKRVAVHLKQEILYHFSVTRPRKILFDHLPKCGGSSLNLYLEAHYLKRKIFSTNGKNSGESVRLFKNLSERNRCGYDLVKGHLTNELVDFVHPEALKVTVFRDPVDRIISHYYYARRTPAHYLYSKIHDSEMSLEDYATSNLSGELRNWYTTHFSGLSAAEAEKRPEESITRAVDVVLRRYDIIGFLDNFLLFIEELRKQANLTYEYQDIKVNKTQERPNIDSVPQSIIRRIEQVNHLDIALYRKIKDAIGYPIKNESTRETIIC